MAWEAMQGQRGTQLVKEFLEMGHRVLYIEIDRSRNQQSYNTGDFTLANVLPRPWVLYDMTPKEKAQGISGIVPRLVRYVDAMGKTRLGRLFWQLFPNKLREGLVLGRKQLIMTCRLPIAIDNDLPVIRERMEKVVDDFCLQGSERLVLYEIPMRCYTECLDIFEERRFKIVYDFIDKWELMWEGEKIRRIDDERGLVEKADLIAVTSKHLMREFLSLYPWRTDALYLPNAVRRDTFDVGKVSHRPANLPHQPTTVGYFGNIGEWFDWETVEYLADQKPEWDFIIIGQYSERPEFPIDIWKRLTSRANVHALGRKAHGELINYLSNWDVCIIPFRDTPLVRATSPVKVYEYLSAYKPVVTFESDEMKGFPCVFHATGKGVFLSKLVDALGATVDKRKIDEFLSQNTWRERALAILNGWTCYQRGDQVKWARVRVKVNAIPRLCSIILLSLNTKNETRDAVESIFQHTDFPHELIVVDNGSTDGSVEMLKNFNARGMIKELLLADRNLGYAGGNNSGLKLAHGEYIVFVNSDVIVSPRWLGRLLRHFGDPSVGAVGPVSQGVGSPAFPQRVRFQNQKARQLLELRRISGFCLATTRRCIDIVGTWDEAFFPGNFDDDDMSIRMRRSGLKLLCDGDVFVHHRMMCTFRANPSLELDKTFWVNKERFERKWPDEPAVIEYAESHW